METLPVQDLENKVDQGEGRYRYSVLHKVDQGEGRYIDTVFSTKLKAKEGE